MVLVLDQLIVVEGTHTAGSSFLEVDRASPL